MRYGLFSKGVDLKRRSVTSLRRDEAKLTLDALLARVLFAFTIEFERESKLLLAMCANLLRVLGAGGVRCKLMGFEQPCRKLIRRHIEIPEGGDSLW